MKKLLTVLLLIGMMSCTKETIKIEPAKPLAVTPVDSNKVVLLTMTDLLGYWKRPYFKDRNVVIYPDNTIYDFEDAQYYEQKSTIALENNKIIIHIKSKPGSGFNDIIYIRDSCYISNDTLFNSSTYYGQPQKNVILYR